MPRYAAKVDANHRQIVTELRQAGLHVTDLSRLGDGVPDLLVTGVSNLSWRVEALLVEVKTDVGALTPTELEWHCNYPDGGPLIVARRAEDVLAWFGRIQ